MGSLAAAGSSLITQLDVELEEPEMVVPVEPTEECSLFLSNIDRAVAFVVDSVYIYRLNGKDKNAAAADVVGRLKEALGKVLVPYHFMAGRLKLNEKGRLEIECNRAGTLFAAANCDLTLSDLGDVTLPNPIFRNLLLQRAHARKFGAKPPLFMMQPVERTRMLLLLVLWEG
eukprot:PITA_21425